MTSDNHDSTSTTTVGEFMEQFDPGEDMVYSFYFPKKGAMTVIVLLQGKDEFLLTNLVIGLEDDEADSDEVTLKHYTSHDSWDTAFARALQDFRTMINEIMDSSEES